MEVGERSGSCGRQGKKGPEVFSSELNVNSGQGARLSPRVEYEPTGISSSSSTCGTPGVARHVSRS